MKKAAMFGHRSLAMTVLTGLAIVGVSVMFVVTMVGFIRYCGEMASL